MLLGRASKAAPVEMDNGRCRFPLTVGNNRYILSLSEGHWERTSGQYYTHASLYEFQRVNAPGASSLGTPVGVYPASSPNGGYHAHIYFKVQRIAVRLCLGVPHAIIFGCIRGHEVGR